MIQGDSEPLGQYWKFAPVCLSSAETDDCRPLLLGDGGKITIGSNSNVQDGTVVRTHQVRLGSSQMKGKNSDTLIGNHVTIGHQVTSSFLPPLPLVTLHV